jgi:ribonuclease HII
LLEFERQAWNDGCRRLAGIDEAGRGPLAGPVVAAAVWFDREFLLREEQGVLAGLDDSKKLSESRREAFYKILSESPAVEIGIGLSDPAEIDETNILHATHVAMARAVRRLVPLPSHALVDGLPVSSLPCASTAIVRGDSKSLSIAAASIAAKVIRDRLMVKLGRVYPRYGFGKHKGYGTRAHISALLEYGPSPIHRQSFQPVKDAQRIGDLNPDRSGDAR